MEQLRIAFDAGIPMHYPVKHILLTHTHSDHAYNLPIVLTETMTFQSTGYDALRNLITSGGLGKCFASLKIALQFKLKRFAF